MNICIYDLVVYNEQISQDYPFLQVMTFHTQSNNRNKIKVDIGRHILNDLNVFT